MQGSGTIRRTRSQLRGPLGLLAVPFRPASSGPVRYWQDHTRLAVKAAIASIAAWALAKYALGLPDPYFAPLAALLGVYPTVARSLREGFQYIGGVFLGVALALPVGLLLGPGVAGIGVVVLAGLMLSGWGRLGDQSAQVTFTALFVLLLGGQHPTHYVIHRLIEVAIGVATGLAVNIVIFPPLQLRPAVHAITRWADDIGQALEVLGDGVADPDAVGRSWPKHDSRLTQSAAQARAAARRARESLRWNPRASVHQAVPRPDDAVLTSLDDLTMLTRASARSLLDYRAQDGAPRLAAEFAGDYVSMLRLLSRAVRQLADPRGGPQPGGEQAEASGCQQRLEAAATRLPQHSGERRLARLAGDMLRAADALGEARPGPSR